jgi:hypothetical protein
MPPSLLMKSVIKSKKDTGKELRQNDNNVVSFTCCLFKKYSLLHMMLVN